MANIIPMAGEGRRFTNAGYKLPKPLIPISGVPMIIKAIRGMPKSDKWIFIVRQEHIDDYNIDRLIISETPSAIIIPVKDTTEGQACSCMLAEKYLEPDEPLFISACDNTYLYDKEKYQKLCEDESVDAIFLTFTKKESMYTNPAALGWCILEEDNLTIKDMSIKIPISKDPYNDHAIVASFFFKKAKYFIDAFNLMIKENYRINNEFYIDAVPIFLKKLEKRSVIFDVDLYIVWGIPEDLYSYQKIEYICNYDINSKEISKEDRKDIPLWKRYFSQS